MISSTTALPPPPYAFATHLLGALRPVRRQYQQTMRQVEGLATMVRSRASAEEAHAKQLERIAGVYDSTSSGGGRGIASSLLRLGTKTPPFDGADEGEDGAQGGVGPSFRECVESVKADLLNSAMQRRQLAKSLLAEVHEPMDALSQNMAAEGQELEEEAGVLAKSLRGLGKRYEEAHRQMERARGQAAALCQQVREQGLEAPTADARRVAKLYAEQQHEAAVVVGVDSGVRSPLGGRKKGADGFLASPFIGLSANSPAAKKLASLSSNLRHQVSRADPTSWLLPSSSTSPSPFPPSSKTRARPGGADTDAAVAQAQAHLEEAGRCRLACRNELLAGAQRAARALQVALTRYQLLEEDCIDEVTKLLRQAVVFEASCVANEQYELQTTFKVIETVDKDKDLEQFVTAQLRKEGECAAKGHAHGEALEAAVARSLGLSLALPPPPPPELAEEEEEEEGAAKPPPQQQQRQPAGAPPVLTPADLPNLSAPAPNVLPARLVLRRLTMAGQEGRSPSPTPPPRPPSIGRPPPPAVDAMPVKGRALPTDPSTSAVASTPSAAPQARCPLPLPRRSPVRMQAEMDADDEEDDEEEGFGASLAKQKQQQTQQQAPGVRSLKAVMQKRHEKQRASGALSPLVDMEDFATEAGGNGHAL